MLWNKQSVSQTMVKVIAINSVQKLLKSELSSGRFGHFKVSALLISRKSSRSVFHGQTELSCKDVITRPNTGLNTSEKVQRVLKCPKALEIARNFQKRKTIKSKGFAIMLSVSQRRNAANVV